MRAQDRIFVALDTTDLDQAVMLAEALRDDVGGMKVGKEFFTALGPQGVERIAETGMPLFLDLKFHDIPNTVAGAIHAAVRLKPFMLNVHALGGAQMMRAAAGAASMAAEKAGFTKPLVIGVTILTSLGEDDLKLVGVKTPVIDEVAKLAILAKASNLDGVVCSAKEIMTLRGACGPDFKLVVPGIRPEWASKDDQKRVVTPAEAIALGADYLVIGRPITAADDPVQAAKRIAEEIQA